MTNSDEIHGLQWELASHVSGVCPAGVPAGITHTLTIFFPQKYDN